MAAFRGTGQRRETKNRASYPYVKHIPMHLTKPARCGKSAAHTVRPLNVNVFKPLINPEYSNQFEEGALIYIPQRKAWHPPSSCLWANNTRISGKLAVAGHYANLRDFFVGDLQVEEPNIAMYVHELKLLVGGNNKPSIASVNELIKEINSYSPRRGALEELKTSPVLPIKGTDGQITLRSTTDFFAIIDRDEYEKLFRYRVAVLDYTLEQAHELRPFISALGLEDRFMSLNVKETSRVNVFSRVSRLSDNIREKAYALFR